MRILAGSRAPLACSLARPGCPAQWRWAYLPAARSASTMFLMKLAAETGGAAFSVLTTNPWEVAVMAIGATFYRDEAGCVAAERTDLIAKVWVEGVG